MEITVFRIENARIISAIKLEKCVAGTSVLGIVIGKLCHEKKPCRIILLKVDKGSEIGFDCTILLFGLLVRLGIKSGNEFLLDTYKIA